MIENILTFDEKNADILSFADDAVAGEKTLLKIVCQDWQCAGGRRKPVGEKSCVFVVGKQQAQFYLDVAQGKLGKITCEPGDYPKVALLSSLESKEDQREKVEKFLAQHPSGIHVLGSEDSPEDEEKAGISIIQLFHHEISEVAWNSPSTLPLDKPEWWIMTGVFSGLKLYNHNTVYQLWKLSSDESRDEMKEEVKEEVKEEDPWWWLYQKILHSGDKKFLDWHKMLTLIVNIWNPMGCDDDGYTEEVKKCFEYHTEYFTWGWYDKLSKLSKLEDKTNFNVAELLRLGSLLVAE